MVTLNRFFLVGLFLGMINILVLSMSAYKADATPAFTRSYETSCVTCHSTYPVLNAVGDAFRLNGYRFRDDEQYLKAEARELGDEVYKKLWPDAMWPGQIPATSGFSAATRMIAEIDVGDKNETREADVIFVLPHEVEFSWCGSLGKGVAAYGDVIFVQEDAGTPDMDAWVTTKAWIELSDLIGPEDMVNLRVGTVGMHTIGLYTAKDEQRLSIQFYQFNTWKLPGINTDKSESVIAFSGNNFSNQPQMGIEVGGFGKNWLYYLGVVNGNVEEDPGSFYFLGVGKNTGEKDYYGGFAYKIGGLGFNGASATDDNPLAGKAEFWRDDSLTLTAFGYTGSAEIVVDRYDDDTYTTHTETRTNDDFWRFSIGARAQYKDLILNTGYQWARDDNPYGTLFPDSVSANAWFVETAYFVYPWLIPYARYEKMDISVPFTGTADDIRIEKKQKGEVVYAGVKAHLRPNVFASLEYQDFINPDFGTITDEILFLMLMFSF